MQYKSLKGFTGLGQFGILCVFLGLGFVLAAVIQVIIGFKMIPSGTALNDMAKVMMDAMAKPENVGYVRALQITGTFFLLFVPTILYSWVTNGRNKFWLGFNPYINISQIAIGFVIIFAANIAATPLEDITKSVVAHFPSIDKIAKQLEDAYNEQVLLLSNLKSWPEFLMAIVIMAFLPSLFEEMFFRGAMQNLLVRWWKQPLLAILVTSLVFSLIHSSIYLFMSRVMLGFALGLMYHTTKNIWVNVIAHFLNNAIALSQLFYMSSNKQKIDPSKLDPTKFDPKIAWGLAVAALIGLYFLFKVLMKISRANREKIDAQEQVLLSRENIHDPFAKNQNS